MRIVWSAALAFGFIVAASVVAQEPRAVEFPPVPDAKIPRYDARRVAGAIRVDGRLDEETWKLAPFSTRFVDLISGERTLHDTRVAVVWDDDFLYLGYRVEEPDVQAKFTDRDSPIWQENDVEFFIAGEDAYYELEINARGTLYEGLFVWQSVYESSGLAKLPALDKTRTDVKWQEFTGVGFRDHPRGKRFAFLAWDLPGLKSAVHVDGTLNDSTDRDRGWTVELAIPWKSIALLNSSKLLALPPAEGDVWRIDTSRFNQYKAPAPAEDSGGWAWSRHGVWDSHIPECFTYVKFSTEVVRP